MPWWIWVILIFIVIGWLVNASDSSKTKGGGTHHPPRPSRPSHPTTTEATNAKPSHSERAYTASAIFDESKTRHSDAPRPRPRRENAHVGKDPAQDVKITPIEEYVKARGIRYLTHFTRITNVPQILAHGLLGPDTLRGRNIPYNSNDVYRYDGISDGVCLSISFPNYKMFYSLQKQYPDADWAILKLRPEVLWEKECIFCVQNAASRRMSGQDLSARTGIIALQAMFADIPGGPQRASLRIPDNFTTDPQAEVIVRSGVQPKFILSVNVNEQSKMANAQRVQSVLERARATTSIELDKNLFAPRTDYEHWRTVGRQGVTAGFEDDDIPF